MQVSSNLCSKMEIGRLPMAKLILEAITMFNERAKSLPHETLTAQAVASERHLTDSYNTLLFNKSATLSGMTLPNIY